MAGSFRYTTLPLSALITRKRWDPRAHVESDLKQSLDHHAPGVRICELASERREQSLPPQDVTETFIYIGLENVEQGTGDLVGNI